MIEWTTALVPVLDKIIATAEGGDQTEFWQSFFHYESSSMGAALTGWITTLFPYLREGRDASLVPNKYFAWDTMMGKQSGGPYVGRFPRASRAHRSRSPTS